MNYDLSVPGQLVENVQASSVEPGMAYADTFSFSLPVDTTVGFQVTGDNLRKYVAAGKAHIFVYFVNTVTSAVVTDASGNAVLTLTESDVDMQPHCGPPLQTNYPCYLGLVSSFQGQALLPAGDYVLNVAGTSYRNTGANLGTEYTVNATVS